MLQKLQLLLLLMFFTFVLKGQIVQISKISGESTSSVCLGQKVYVAYTKTGIYNQDNSFKIQLRPAYSNTWIDVSTKDSSGYLVGTLPSNVHNISNGYSNYASFRIVSSSPEGSSDIESYVNIYLPADIELLNLSKKTLLSYEPVSLSVKYGGTLPIKILTSDSMSVEVLSGDNNIYNTLVSITKSGSYSVINASNVCGIGKSSGKVDITVVETGLKILGYTQEQICKNNKIELKVQKIGKWSTENKFKIRLVKEDDRSKFYELDATEKDDIITATIGTDVLKGNYIIKVISDNSIETDYFVKPLGIHDETSVELVTESTSMKYGATQMLSVVAKGYGIQSIELSDGQIYDTYFSSNDSQTINFYVSPSVSTQYFIKSYTSLCGNSTGKNKMLLTINEGIKTGTLKYGQYCEGASCEVTFSTNVSIPVGNTVKVRLRNSFFEYKDVEGKVVRENVASFIVPSNFVVNTMTNNEVYASVSTENLTSTNFSPNYISIILTPSASIVDAFSSVNINVEQPQALYLHSTLTGGSPYEIVFNDSLVHRFESFSNEMVSYATLEPFVLKSGKVFITSVKNMCGTSYPPTSEYKNIKMQSDEYAIRIDSKKQLTVEVCAGAKLDLSILTKGKYKEDNQFLVEIFGRTVNGYSELGTISVGEGQVLIPENLPSGVYNLRVSSSNPVTKSNLLILTVNALPTAKLYTYKTTPVNSGETVTVMLETSGDGTQTITYNDGTVETSYGTSPVKWKKLFNTTTFGIKSISNGCGVGTVLSKDFTIRVMPYAINNQIAINSVENIQCLTDKILVPFELKGKVPLGETFSIQISESSDTVYTTLQSGITVSPAHVSLPSNFSSGKYNIRIVNKDKSIKSEESTISYHTVPSMTMQLSDGKSEIEMSEGKPILLTTKTDRVSPSLMSGKYTIVDDNNIRNLGTFYNNYFEEYKYPTESTTYRLSSVVNDCGLGTASGSVKVLIKPILSMNVKGFSNGNSISACIDTPLDVDLSSKGTFGNNNLFKVFAIDENNTKIELLSTSKNDIYKITFGNKFKKGVYRLQLESTNPILSKEISIISLTTKLDITLTGSSTINPEFQGLLFLRKNNDTYLPENTSFYEIINYEMTNGQTGSVEVNYANPLPLVYVTLNKTEIYTLKSVSNACGVGKASGSATITVNPYSEKQVYTFNLTNSTLCAGTDFYVSFSIQGTFSASNKFTIQLSDDVGNNFKNLETTGTLSPLKAKLPTGLLPNIGYKIRVVASDPNTTTTTTTFPITILEGITARFDSSSYYFNENKPVSIGIKLTGTPPFTFAIGSDEVNAKSITVNTNDYVLTINPTANTVYRLFSVNNNVCGTGTVLSPSTVRIELITGTDELGKMGINLFPNPASDVLNIESNDKELDVQLIDFVGKIVQEQTLRGVQKQVDLSRIPSGTYFLHIQKEGRKATFKVLKQ